MELSIVKHRISLQSWQIAIFNYILMVLPISVTGSESENVFDFCHNF